MRSRNTSSAPRRAATLAGLLALGSLVLPGVVHARDLEAERALLNKSDVPFGVSETNATPVIDGARALLGQPGVGAPQVRQPVESSHKALGGAYRIDGQRALLGASGPAATTGARSALRN